MALEVKLTEDMIAAQKTGDAARLDTLRFVIAQIRNRTIEKRTKGNRDPLTDAEVTEVLQREAKKRREAIEMFLKGGREDLSKKEESELTIIESYLPKMMSREEIRKVVETIAAKSGGDFKLLMREAMTELRGRADGKTVSEVVQEFVK